MTASELHHLAKALRNLALQITSNSDELALSAGELAIIEDISRHDGASIGEIAARTRLAQSMVSKTVIMYRDEHIVTLEPDAKDRRRMLVTLDPTVRQEIFRERGSRDVGAVMPTLLPHLTEADRAELLRALKLVGRYLAPNETGQIPTEPDAL